MKKICIRVDGNEIIATGHVMRCLSIAEQIRKLGAEVVFVVADDRTCPIIRDKNYDCHVLNTIWNEMNTETDLFVEFIKNNDITTVLVDSYYVTDEYLIQLSKVVDVCYIDDLDEMIYPVHTIINYNLQCDRDYKVKYKNAGQNTIFLLGGAYAPLREEFAYIPYTLKQQVTKVLITTGGTDQLNMTYSLMEAFLQNTTTSNLEYHIIIGRFNQNKKAIEKLTDNKPNIILHENVSNMSFWMRNCDVAISAAGTTKYELAACGIPSICFEVADNQEGACDWEKGGYMLYAGNACREQGRCISRCVDQLVRLYEDFSLRKKLSQNMQGLIDGKGAERIAQYLVKMNQK